MADLFELNNIPPEIAVDLVSLTRSLSGIPRRGTVKYRDVDFKYCLLDDIVDTIKESEQWAVLTPLREVDNHAEVMALLVHKSGYIIKSPSYSIFYPQSARAQEKAAQITYARRYVLSSFLNIAADDDTDGNDSEGTPTPPPPLPSKQPISAFNGFYQDMIVNFALVQGLTQDDLRKYKPLATDKSVKITSKALVDTVLSRDVPTDQKCRCINELLKRNPISLGLTDDVLAGISRAYVFVVDGKPLKSMTSEELLEAGKELEDTKILAAITYLRRFDPTKALIKAEKVL